MTCRTRDVCRTCHEVKQRGPQGVQVAGGLRGAAELLGSLGAEEGVATVVGCSVYMTLGDSSTPPYPHCQK